MTRKHYRFMADIIKAATPETVDDHETMISYYVSKQIADGLSDVLKSDDPRFDHATFMAACFGSVKFENGYLP